MLYPYWWSLAWVVPLMALVWFLFGGISRRYGEYYDPRRVSRNPEWEATRGRLSAPGKHRNRGPRNYRRSDSRIAEDVSDYLMINDQIDAGAIDVEVRDGNVTLSGAVATRFEKRLAEQLADNVPGVSDVHNHLRIGVTRGDEPPPVTVEAT